MEAGGGRGAGSEGGDAGRGVGRGQALANLLAARRRAQAGPGVDSSASSAVSAGRGQLLRQLVRDREGQADTNSSISTVTSSQPSVGGGRGEFLRKMARQVGTSPSNSSEASSSVSGRPVPPTPVGRAGMVSVFLFLQPDSW